MVRWFVSWATLLVSPNARRWPPGVRPAADPAAGVAVLKGALAVRGTENPAGIVAAVHLLGCARLVLDSRGPAAIIERTGGASRPRSVATSVRRSPSPLTVRTCTSCRIRTRGPAQLAVVQGEGGRARLRIVGGDLGHGFRFSGAEPLNQAVRLCRELIRSVGERASRQSAVGHDAAPLRRRSRRARAVQLTQEVYRAVTPRTRRRVGV